VRAKGLRRLRQPHRENREKRATNSFISDENFYKLVLRRRFVATAFFAT